MNTNAFLSYINSKVAEGSYPTLEHPTRTRRAITISRQAGCGAQVIAEKLAARLQKRTADNASPWTVFDRNLMDKVLEDHQLPKYLASVLPEDRIPAIEDALDDIFGLHPPQEIIVRHTAETILGLAELGNVILIGRAGNIVTAKMSQVLHVRLVAPLEQRIEHAGQIYSMTPIQARNFCLHEDLGRERYLRKHFNADINNPLHYHLIVNTGLINYDLAAQLIEDALISLE